MYPTCTSEISEISRHIIKISAGYNDVSTNILKLSLPYIADPLHKLVNISFNEGVFPDKIARIIPIFKDGEEDIF